MKISKRPPVNILMISNKLLESMHVGVSGMQKHFKKLPDAIQKLIDLKKLGELRDNLRDAIAMYDEEGNLNPLSHIKQLAAGRLKKEYERKKQLINDETQRYNNEIVVLKRKWSDTINDKKRVLSQIRVDSKANIVVIRSERDKIMVDRSKNIVAKGLRLADVRKECLRRFARVINLFEAAFVETKYEDEILDDIRFIRSRKKSKRVSNSSVSQNSVTSKNNTGRWDRLIELTNIISNVNHPQRKKALAEKLANYTDVEMRQAENPPTSDGSVMPKGFRN